MRAITASDIPPLEPYCGSWIVVRRSDGQPIGEFFNRRNLHHFNAERVTIKTAAQYLGEVNAALRPRT